MYILKLIFIFIAFIAFSAAIESLANYIKNRSIDNGK